MTKPKWLEPPDDLDPKAATYWRYYAASLHRAGKLTWDAYETFRTLCVLLAARDAAAADVGANGVTFKVPSGAIKANPALSALLQIERRVEELLSEFGRSGD